MDLAPGATLAHYRLVEKIGEGGMGVVWRASDATLDRDVALKFLPDLLARDPERAARFEREAKLLGSLHHPNIATVHGFHQDEGLRFLAMEYVPGEDLAQHLSRGPLPIDEALEIAGQIAEALEAAHERGVVHRDLKPANVKVPPDGRVKVLDFGLAKAIHGDPSSSAADASRSPTVTTMGTVAGVILGTAAYMAPEQARGRSVDRRADLWSFGCVLFEMLTGKRAFAGETVTDILASVVAREPEWEALPAATPAAIRRLLARCLAKDPRVRQRDAGDARLEIQEARAALGKSDPEVQPLPRPHPSRARLLLPWAIAAACALAAGTALWSARQPREIQPTHLSVALPETEVLDGGPESAFMAISRDGRRLAYCSRLEGTIRLHLRRLDQPEAVMLAGTEGASHPFFSPDGEWIGFFAEGQLEKVSVAGGVPIAIAPAPAHRGAVWLPDDTIVYSPAFASPLMRVPASGGTPTPLTTLDEARRERTHRWPDALPGGEWVIFTVGVLGSPGKYDDARIDAVSVRSGERRTLLEGASMARPSWSGDLLFARSGDLMAAPLDLSGPKVVGTGRPVLEGVATIAASGIAHFGVAENGTLAYIAGGAEERDVEMAWVDRSGGVEKLPLPAREYLMFAIAPDGRRVLMTVGADIWLYEVGRGAFTRVTFDQLDAGLPAWTPDGERFIHTVQKKGFQLVLERLDGSAPGSPLATSQVALISQGITPDQRRALFFASGDDKRGIASVLLDGSGGEQIVVPGAAWGGAISPDGKWLAHVTNETGRPEVYLIPLAGRGRKRQVSSGGGDEPRWAARTGELFFIEGEAMMVTTVEGDESNPIVAPPRKLFEFTPGLGRPLATLPRYDVTPDGTRFLTTISTHPGAARRRIDVVLGWPLELKGRG